MGFLDLLLTAAEVVDALSDHSTPYDFKCDTLELFEIGTKWQGTARVHGAGTHVATEQVSFSETLTMPDENERNLTRRGVLRDKFRKWCGKEFSEGGALPKEAIVLNHGENCLSCEGFVKKTSKGWVITNHANGAKYYGSYKIFVSSKGKPLGYEDLEYLFKAETVARISSVDVHDGF